MIVRVMILYKILSTETALRNLKETAVVRIKHGYVNIVIPWNKSIMANSAEQGTAVKKVMNPFLFTKICDSLQNPEFSLLYRF